MSCGFTEECLLLDPAFMRDEEDLAFEIGNMGFSRFDPLLLSVPPPPPPMDPLLLARFVKEEEADESVFEIWMELSECLLCFSASVATDKKEVSGSVSGEDSGEVLRMLLLLRYFELMDCLREGPSTLNLNGTGEEGLREGLLEGPSTLYLNGEGEEAISVEGTSVTGFNTGFNEADGGKL